MTECKKTIRLSLADFEIEVKRYLLDYGLSKEEIKAIAKDSFTDFNWDLLSNEIFDCMDTIIYNNYQEHLIQKEAEENQNESD